jgi:hypothetical protein
MRPKPLQKLEQYRVRQGPFASDEKHGNNGQFVVPSPWNTVLLCQVSNGAGWEHVSVSVRGQERTPAWEEMHFVKGLFWDDEETVVEFHPKQSQYVNCHPYVLHLWKRPNADWLLPPSILVGPK